MVLVQAVLDLFFSTEVHVSINGHLAAPLQQQRGLRQGNLLSPLLSNLAFEPLLVRLLMGPSLTGIPIYPALKPRGSKTSGSSALFPDASPT
jgi:hypothetical protein